MCGICGIYNTKQGPYPDKDLLLKMMYRIKHRGPDACGYYLDKKTALGHTRLSIIDLSSGNQPLTNEDESIWITFNGEIFNYKELTEELVSKGHIFKSNSDTEVIIHAYEEWGIDSFNHFNGQWAFALWDTRKKEIILSRDRMGIRPLFYTFSKNKFLFASEIKSLFEDKEVHREIDAYGLSENFTFWSPIAPRTVFKDIKELEPGHYAIIKEKNIITKKYWTLSFPKKSYSLQSKKENAEKLKEELINASSLRFTRSDVPVGAYLSGGIDSSVTSAVIANETNTKLATFSLRFSEPEFDEGKYQKEMSKILGTNHKDIIVKPEDIGNIFPDVIWHTERPILRTAPAPLFMLSKLVRESGYKVVVTGEGADEILGGYDIFRETIVRKFVANNPNSKIRPEIINKLYPWMERSPLQAPAFAQAFFSKNLNTEHPCFSHLPRWTATEAIKLILNPDIKELMSKENVIENFSKRLPKEHKDWTSLGRAQWIEIVSLLSSYILSAQGDRMLMANSIEGRFPFLDFNLINFANALPAEHKLLGLDEKHLLKLAFSDVIPKSILKRPKQPYRAPDASSFFFSNKIDWVNEICSESFIKEAGIFNHLAVNKMLSKCRKNKGLRMSNTDNMRILAILSTMLVYSQFIKQNKRTTNYKSLKPTVCIIKR